MFRAKEAMKKGNDKANFSILERHDERRWRHTLWCPVFLQHPDHGELFFNSASRPYIEHMAVHSGLIRAP